MALSFGMKMVKSLVGILLSKLYSYDKIDCTKSVMSAIF